MVFAMALALGFLSTSAHADIAALRLPDLVSTGRSDSLIGVADSATEGTVSQEELATRPIARPGEVLETVPGMIITQHAGGGKANQYYLRGFNLDHGTDFAFYMDGVPINLVSHAHGQGYTDLNWLIPEIVERLDYRKGVYYADQGDFANAGAAEIHTYTVLPQNIETVTAGTLGEERAMIARSPKEGDGHLLYALEVNHYDGAFVPKMNYRRFNVLSRYSEGDPSRGYSFSAQAYYGVWLGSEQVPERALLDDQISRFDSLDPSTGGNTGRYSLYGEWHRQNAESATQFTVYAAHYDLDLFSDFTYFLNQTQGDQIEQKDNREYTGLRAQHTIYGSLAGHDMENSFGFQARQDWVHTNLNHSQNRVVWQHVRTDHVSELNLAPWAQNKVRWLPWFRTVAGARVDLYHFGNQSDSAPNSGSRWNSIASPKLSLIFGPWATTEFYLEGGYGFRTNDARGIFSTVDPVAGTPTSMIPPLVRTKGLELGVRTGVVQGLQSTLAFWSLWSASDLFFDGDSGATVDSGRAGKRYGVINRPIS
jgi:outer membrane cobalamin receptor